MKQEIFGCFNTIKALWTGKGQALYKRNWMAFWILGTINNLCYVIVLSAAQSLASQFEGTEKFIGLIPWANICFGFLAQCNFLMSFDTIIAINGFLLENVPHVYRLILAASMATIGLLVVAFSIFVSFWMTIIGIIFVGASSAFGETVILGYLKSFPSDMVGGWSSGTGMAGLGGALLYLGFTAIKLPNLVVFCILVPCWIIYIFVFIFVVKKPTKEDLEFLNETANQNLLKTVKENKVETNQSEETISIIETNEKGIIGRLKRYWRCYKACWFMAFQILILYWSQYTTSVGGANHSQVPGFQKSKYFHIRNAYIILSICYQLGVFISRSSLSVIKIPQTYILVAIQCINLGIWIAHSFLKFMNIFLQFASMTFVGLIGGATYVNVYYNMLNDKRLNDKDRELCVNMIAMHLTLGVTIASLTMLLLDNTVWKGV